MKIETKGLVSNKAIEQWVELYSDQLYSWALNRTSSREIAEDLVQETFLAVLHSARSFDNKSEPKTWLFSILKNKIADHYRKAFKIGENKNVTFTEFFNDAGVWNSTEAPHQWQEDEDSNLLDNHDFNKILQACLNNLPDKWKSSVVLKFIEEKSSKEICQDLEVNTTNYWQIMHRAKLQLRKCIEINWFNR